MRTIEYIYMTFIVSIDIEFIMSIDTINVVYECCVSRREKKETYMKVIVSIHIITASLSTTQLAVLGGEGVWGTTQTKACVGGEGRAARYASASGAS